MTIEIELQVASDAKTLPHPAQFREWISYTLPNKINSADLTIRIVDEDESAGLNLEYRNKKGPTNVLSFPYEPPMDIAVDIMGDIVICAPIVEKEANALEKPLLEHWAHMVVHGTLHLLGYDHVTDTEAKEMESLETSILLQLGFNPPYGA